MNRNITISIKDVLVLVLFLVLLNATKNSDKNSSVGTYSISSDCNYLYKMNNQTGDVYYWWGNNQTGSWKKWGQGF